MPSGPKHQFGPKKRKLQQRMSEILPLANCLMGIDVSHYQGTIDWAKVAGSGVKFAYIKATEGVATDPMLKANADGARAAGLPFGLYHFWRPTIDTQPQINIFDNAVVTTRPDLPDVLDIETGALPEEEQGAALCWLDARITGRAFVYVAPSYAQVNLTDPAWLSYPLWIAHYTEAAQPNIVKWPKWTFWQRQCNATVDGISTPVDIDWFNGNEEDFRKLLNPGT
jgi:lysozyme